jgi:hypothetical protein
LNREESDEAGKEIGAAGEDELKTETRKKR